MTTSIIMCGAAGRMGQTILRCASEDSEIEITGGVEWAGSAVVGSTVGQVIGRPGLEQPIVDSIEKLPVANKPVAIHFSSPEATGVQLDWSVRNGFGVIIGTTGLNSSQRAAIEKAATKVPVVFAPNMSVGVNTLFKIVADVTRILGEAYDVEVTEMHHRFKKDAPSGTARRLAEVVAQAMGASYEDLVVDGRSGITGERPRRQIGMHALRGGDVVGDHTVTFATLGERIELTHKAHGRETFALGALRAAKWIGHQSAGFYDMQDVLGIR